MLPKSIRLPHSTRLFRGKTFVQPHFLLKVASSPAGAKRFGVVISKKVDKRAVARNRMRRLLHTFIQDNLNLFPEGYDYLFIVTKSFEKYPSQMRENIITFLGEEKR